MRYRLHELEFDEKNERHIARRGITILELLQLLSNDNVLAENPHGGEGRILLIGKTNGGRCITVALAQTSDPTTWRPLTAWTSTPVERSVLERNVR